MSSTEEVTFFDEGSVRITNTRFIALEQTYAMSGVTAVKPSRQDPSRGLSIILGIIGLLCLTGGGGAIFVGLLFLAAAVIAWVNAKATYYVVLSTSSGETKALSSKDGAFITRVINALNDSIVHRG